MRKTEIETDITLAEIVTWGGIIGVGTENGFESGIPTGIGTIVTVLGIVWASGVLAATLVIMT